VARKCDRIFRKCHPERSLARLCAKRSRRICGSRTPCGMDSSGKSIDQLRPSSSALPPVPTWSHSSPSQHQLERA
jgi:hypothetical protein